MFAEILKQIQIETNEQQQQRMVSGIRTRK
jgi:hypothetical protein